jgi:ABC-type uncharacterized transport system ATPase subunit
MINSRGSAVVFDHVSKFFGTKQVLRDVSFDVRAREKRFAFWGAVEPIRA